VECPDFWQEAELRRERGSHADYENRRGRWNVRSRSGQAGFSLVTRKEFRRRPRSICRPRNSSLGVVSVIWANPPVTGMKTTRELPSTSRSESNARPAEPEVQQGSSPMMFELSCSWERTCRSPAAFSFGMASPLLSEILRWMMERQCGDEENHMVADGAGNEGGAPIRWRRA